MYQGKKKTGGAGDSLFDRKPSKIWEPGTKVIVDRLARWKLDKWVEKLMLIDDEVKLRLLETDSRLREDRIFLEQGKTVDAGNVKARLEQEQRERRKKLEDEGGEYVPRFFVDSDYRGLRIFRYNHEYDLELEEKLQIVIQNRATNND